MKLISMTDFVLEQTKNFNAVVYDDLETASINLIERIENYANFLNQPLKLEMFVPCNENGNVLEEPKRWKDYLQYPDSFDGNKEWDELYDYQQAKEKVLFEGFKIYDYKLNVFFYLGRRKTLSYDKKRKDFITIGLLPETVEDLINISSQIKLSRTALNAIFG